MTFGWKGLKNRALEFPAGDGVAVAPPGRARIRYNLATNLAEISFSENPYTPMATGSGSSPWEEASPGLVTLVDQADVVALYSDIYLVPATPVAGANSPEIRFFASILTEALREWSIQLKGSVADDVSTLSISGPGATGPNAFTMTQDRTTGNTRVKANAPLLHTLGEGIGIHLAINATYVINSNVDAEFQRFTTNDGTVRDVTLPTPEAGLGYWIQCDAGSPGSIRVGYDAFTQTLNPGERCRFCSVTAAWTTWGPL